MQLSTFDGIMNKRGGFGSGHVGGNRDAVGANVEIRMLIRERELADYVAAADYMNRLDLDVVILEYEFGIWPDAHILCLVNRLRVPLLTTVHTVSRSYPKV